MTPEIGGGGGLLVRVEVSSKLLVFRQWNPYQWVYRCTWLRSGIEKRHAIRGIALDSSCDRESCHASESWLVNIYLTIDSSSLVITLSLHRKGDAIGSLGLDLKIRYIAS